MQTTLARSLPLLTAVHHQHILAKNLNLKIQIVVPHYPDFLITSWHLAISPGTRSGKACILDTRQKLNGSYLLSLLMWQETMTPESPIPAAPLTDSFIIDYMKYAKISNGTKPTVSGILKTNAYSPIYLASRTQREIFKVSLVSTLPT